MTTVDHKTRHVWARMATGKVRYAYQLCNARADPGDVAKLEADEAARREIWYSGGATVL